MRSATVQSTYDAAPGSTTPAPPSDSCRGPQAVGYPIPAEAAHEKIDIQRRQSIGRDLNWVPTMLTDTTRSALQQLHAGRTPFGADLNVEACKAILSRFEGLEQLLHQLLVAAFRQDVEHKLVARIQQRLDRPVLLDCDRQARRVKASLQMQHPGAWSSHTVHISFNKVGPVRHAFLPTTHKRRNALHNCKFSPGDMSCSCRGGD